MLLKRPHAAHSCITDVNWLCGVPLQRSGDCSLQSVHFK